MKVAIYWYGAEGQSNYQYYLKKGDDVTIVTTAVSDDYPIPDGAKSIVRDDAYDHLNGFDLVVRSAGVRPDSLKTDGKIWSATNEFFAECKAPIIGVTGTKGKGTTASLIASILEAAGKTVHLVGNIGIPPLERLEQIEPDHIVVFELSSFQLWDIEYSPHIAVVLMIEPDHLNVHTNMDEYVNAKAGIARQQGIEDTVVYHPTNRYSAYIADESAGKKLRYAIPDDGGVYVRDGYFYEGDSPLCPVTALQLPGQHNIDNACAAISAIRVITQDKEAIERGLRAFTGLPHRLKFVGEVDGVKYYDDSIATTPGSATAALRSFAEPKIIILGGSDKGAEYSEVIDEVAVTDSTIIAIGQTGSHIQELALARGCKVARVEGKMNEVVLKARELAEAGSIVILSPASASFDQYHGYSDRGDQFVAAVESL